MLSSEAFGSTWRPRFAALALATVLLAGCQARPLYGSASGASAAIVVSPADSRVEQVVRNELVLRLGGDRSAGDYRLELSASASSGGLLPGGIDNEFSAARTTVSATYVLKSEATGETVKTGARTADAQLDLPSQQFAQQRAYRDAEDRAARALAALIQADIAAALAR